MAISSKSLALSGPQFPRLYNGSIGQRFHEGLMALHLAAEVTGWYHWAWPGVLGAAGQEGLR